MVGNWKGKFGFSLDRPSLASLPCTEGEETERVDRLAGSNLYRFFGQWFGVCKKKVQNSVGAARAFFLLSSSFNSPQTVFFAMICLKTVQ